MKIMTTEEAAEFLGLTVRSLKHYRTKKIGPTYLQVEGQVKYLKADLVAYIKSKRVITHKQGA